MSLTGLKKMNMKGVTIVCIMFLLGPLTGTTGHVPTLCGLEGEHYLLQCPFHISSIATNSQNTQYRVNWFQKSGVNGSLKAVPQASARFSFTGRALEFWPVEVNDTGKYVCSNGSLPSSDLIFNVLQKNKNSCFSTQCAQKTFGRRGNYFLMPCGMAKSERYQNISIMWYKDCHFYQANVLELRFMELQDHDSGYYTCVVTLMHEGKAYNHTRTTHLKIKEPQETVQPYILGDDAINYEDIDIGSSKILTCTAFTGYANNNNMYPYWLQIHSNGSRTFPNDCDYGHIPCEKKPTLNNSEGRIYKTSKLKFQNVKEEHLEYNYTCILSSPHKVQQRTFILKKKEKTTDIPKHVFTTGMIMAVVSAIVFLVLTGVCFMFRIEIILSYRSLTGKDETLSDGKEYDAYVSYLRYPLLGDEERTFALDILSRTLENNFGYSLCIYERDVMPGGAILEEISSYIDKSRRIIIILSKKYLSDNAMYELENGLYASLVERKMKVILIEYNLQWDFNLIPESLHLLKSSSKIKWKEEKSRPLNSRFWKKIRYLLPAKPLRSTLFSDSDTMHDSI